MNVFSLPKLRLYFIKLGTIDYAKAYQIQQQMQLAHTHTHTHTHTHKAKSIAAAKLSHQPMQ